MTNVLNFLNGKKTIIGILVAAIYGNLILLGYTPSETSIWTIIATWTGISFNLKLNKIIKPVDNSTKNANLPPAEKYIPPPPIEPPEVLAG